ncbi:MAG: methyltransferase [Candidatus Heimdallarchaeota archaeon]|nr:MAG: methyltransferase [Candidatus Heimdallarchaeota archaeon]
MAFPELKLKKNPNVYPPQEDTWFMVDVLETQLHREILNRNRSILVCEVGIGSGFISIVLAKKYPMINFIGTDLSYQSAILSFKNMKDHLPRNQYDIVCMDRLRSFNPSKFSPDIIFFNPPYVRTSLEEMRKGFLEKSWAGGPKGITVIQEFLKDLTRFFFGKAFFLSSIFNENESLERDFKEEFIFRVISQRKIENEKLICYEVRSR